MLDKLEREPKFDGTWQEGEIKPLNHHIPVKKIEPLKKRRKLEDVDDENARKPAAAAPRPPKHFLFVN